MPVYWITRAGHLFTDPHADRQCLTLVVRQEGSDTAMWADVKVNGVRVAGMIAPFPLKFVDERSDDSRYVIESVLMWCGVEALRIGLTSGAFPPVDGRDRITITVDADEIEAMERARGSKACASQRTEADALYCYAG